MHFYKPTLALLFQEFDPAFRRTRYRVDTWTGFICFDSEQEATQHVYLALNTSSPISLRLTCEPQAGRTMGASSMKIGDQIIAGFEPITEENVATYRGTLALRYAGEMKDASGIPIQTVIASAQADVSHSGNDRSTLFLIFKDYSAMMIDGDYNVQVGFADPKEKEA